MTPILSGTLAGLALGVASIIPMAFMPIADKRTAMLASFIDRFAIGFIILNMELPMPGWAKGLLVGLVLSLPPALISKKYGPILGLGAIGGLVCGSVAG
ncbi:MAG: hypothetical protein KA175_11010 [Flavobacteriales bacterium]|nr:hypothetical protein [Flavobacteriales bacterium]MBP7156937.1 hypothetical protein [Flavobacteriales bacterium]